MFQIGLSAEEIERQEQVKLKQQMTMNLSKRMFLLVLYIFYLVGMSILFFMQSDLKDDKLIAYITIIFIAICNIICTICPVKAFNVFYRFGKKMMNKSYWADEGIIVTKQKSYKWFIGIVLTFIILSIVSMSLFLACLSL